MTTHDEASRNVPLTVADAGDVISWGWDGRRLCNKLIDLRYETMEGMTPQGQGDPDQWASIYMDHPDTWRLLVEGPESIVGFWHFVSLYEEAFAMARGGRILSSKITADMVHPLKQPGWYDIYVVSICVKSRLRKTSALNQIAKTFFDVVTKLARKGVLIREVCGNASTRTGLAFNTALGLTYVADHEAHGRIFAGHLPSLLEQNRLRAEHEFDTSELYELYGLKPH